MTEKTPPPRRVLATLRRRGSALMRSPAAIVMLLCFAILTGMFASNSDWGGDAKTPRGDGKYRPVLARGDGHMMFLMTRSLVLDGDLVYDNELARFGDPWRQPVTKTGRKMIPHPIGPSLAQVPAFVFAHGTSKVLNAAGADIPSHGYTIYHQRIVFFLSVLAAFGTALFGFRASQKQIGGRWAPLYGTVAVLFGTSLIYYATYMPSYAHALDAFFCAAFLGYWVLSIGEWRWRRFAILGVLLGMAALIRVTGFGLGIVVLVEVLARVLKRPPSGERWRHIARALALGALTLGVSLIVFIPQLITWKLVFGEWLTSPMGPRFMRLSAPEWLEVLFSSRNGWLSSHPIAYAGVLGLFTVPRRARLIAGGLFAAVVLQVYVNSCVFDWWSGASFGQRRLCSLTFVLIFGFAALTRAAGIALARVPVWARHGIAAIVLGWFVAWNMSQLHALRSGKAANSSLRKMCCDRVPKPFSSIAKPIHDRIGNPFALPASLYVKARYGVPLKRWDEIVGNYADLPDLRLYNQYKHRRGTRGWNFPTPYLTGGFGPPQKDPPIGDDHGPQKRSFRWTTAPEAGLLIPLFVADEARRFSLWVHANVGAGSQPVQILMNGTVFFDEAIGPGWSKIDFDVPASGLRRGLNHLVVRSTPKAHEAAPLPPLRKDAVGVAVRDLAIGYPAP